MTLLRRVLGETLRGRRLRQRRTLREVSGAARVSLGYLSEVERGQKEASSELLASICDALDVRLSDLLREVSETMRRSERAAEVARMPGRVIMPAPARRPVPAGVGGRPDLPEFGAEFDEQFARDGFGPDGFDAEEMDNDPFAGRSTDAPAGASDALVDPAAPAAGEPALDGMGLDGLAVDGLALDGLGLDGQGLDGLGLDGLGVDGLGVDGLGVDGLGVDGLGVDGLGLDGLGGIDGLDRDRRADPVGPGDLDGVDLAELEAGDELGDLEMILARTELAGGFDGPHPARCLAAVA